MADINANNKSPNILGKIIWGFVVRIIITIVFAIAVGRAIPVLSQAVGFDVPRWFKPVLIIGSIILGIVLVILYAVRVFKIMQAGFMNMEQMAANAANATFQEYTDYGQQMNMYGQNVYNQYPQGTPGAQVSGQVSSYASPSQTQSSGMGCFLKGIVIILLTFTLGATGAALVGYNLLYQKEVNTFDPCTGIVTSVEQYTYTTYDDEGEPEEETKYDADYEYEYKGEKYTKNIKSSEHYYEGDKIELYVNPNDPAEVVIKQPEEAMKITMTIGVVVCIIYLLTVIGVAKSGKRRY